jgi:hypothetical protein
VSESDASQDEVHRHRGPNGEQLTRQRRLTYREARPWLKRSGVRIGVEPCGTDVRWLRDDERQEYVQHLRHAEGRDCNVAGDVLLYYMTDSTTVLVIEEPISGPRG